MSDPESNWTPVEREIASLLAEIPREDPRGIPQPLSDAPCKAYRFLWAALVVSGAVVVISIVSRTSPGSQQRSLGDGGLLEAVAEHHT
jgi:hypothetical protein